MKRLLLATLAFAAAPGFAQTYPAKPVTLVVPFAPGGLAELGARSIGQKMAEDWGQPVVIESRGGAGGNIAAEQVTRTAPDGYTVLYGIDALAISKSLYRKLNYDPATDLAPVTQLLSSFFVLVTNPKVPASNLKEFIALAKSKPGALSFGSGGIGTPAHFGLELLKISAGIDMLHIPYKGSAPASAALLAGDTQLHLTPLGGILGAIKGGKVRVLGMSAPKRSAAIPDVPTIAEAAGLPGFEVTSWVGLFVPAKTPAPVIARLQSVAAKAVHQPGLVEKWPGWGYDPVGSTTEAFAARFKADMARHARVIKQAKVPLQD